LGNRLLQKDGERTGPQFCRENEAQQAAYSGGEEVKEPSGFTTLREVTLTRCWRGTDGSDYAAKSDRLAAYSLLHLSQEVENVRVGRSEDYGRSSVHLGTAHFGM